MTKSVKSELAKCLDGEMFETGDAELLMIIEKSRDLVQRYNSAPFFSNTERSKILEELFAAVGKNVKIDRPFYCDYGRHIHIGNNVIINMNCTFVDNNKIHIGNNVLIASNVQIYTSTHPVPVHERIVENTQKDAHASFFRTYALPVTIGNNVWIGGGAIILPGVSIGDNSVIGAGSVVNKSIPPNSLAVGNPCRVIRTYTESKDREMAHPLNNLALCE